MKIQSILELHDKIDKIPRPSDFEIEISLKNALELQDYYCYDQLILIKHKPFEVGDKFKFKGHNCKVVKNNL